MPAIRLPRQQMTSLARWILPRKGGRALRFRDVRGRRIIFVPHCVLNQNARVAGAAEHVAAVEELIQGLLAREIGIVQMPCPEFMLFGLDRANVPLRERLREGHCQSRLQDLVDGTLFQVEQYQSCGIDVVGILGKNGSPTCGVELTWISGVVPGEGLFTERLRLEIEARSLSINLAGYCDGAPEEILRTIDQWLNEAR